MAVEARWAEIMFVPFRIISALSFCLIGMDEGSEFEWRDCFGVTA
jgi:hypothetical protein